MPDQENPVVEMAMSLIRDVRDRLERFEQKLDAQGDKHSASVEALGRLEVRVSTLEDSHKWVKGLLGTLLGGIMLALVYRFIK